MTQGPQDGHGTRRWGKDAHPDDYNHRFGQPQGAGPAAGPAMQPKMMMKKKMKRK